MHCACRSQALHRLCENGLRVLSNRLARVGETQSSEDQNMRRHLLNSRQSGAICGAVALMGGALSVVMVWPGGSLARFLPGVEFHLAALIGAALAGGALADAFGHRGIWGYVAALFAALVMTGLGAMLGSFVITLQGDLGLLAVVDALTTSIAAICVWSMGVIGVQLWARRVRRWPERT